MVYPDVRTSVARHARIRSFTGVLDHRAATALLNGQEPCGAVMEVAREHNSHHTHAVGQGSRAKEDIDGGSEILFLRPLAQRDITSADHEMMIRGRHIDALVGNRFFLETWVASRDPQAVSSAGSVL